VVRYLEKLGVDSEKMAAIGMSKHRPVASNDTLEGRQQNRRIEIVLYPKDIQAIMATLP
jgi:chemotaxis protein MotB